MDRCSVKALMTTRRCSLLLLGAASLALTGGCSIIVSNDVADNDAPNVSALDAALEDATVIETLDNGCFVVALDVPEEGEAEPQVVCPIVGGSNQ